MVDNGANQECPAVENAIDITKDDAIRWGAVDGDGHDSSQGLTSAAASVLSMNAPTLDNSDVDEDPFGGLPSMEPPTDGEGLVCGIAAGNNAQLADGSRFAQTPGEEDDTPARTIVFHRGESADLPPGESLVGRSGESSVGCSGESKLEVDGEASRLPATLARDDGGMTSFLEEVDCAHNSERSKSPPAGSPVENYGGKNVTFGTANADLTIANSANTFVGLSGVTDSVGLLSYDSNSNENWCSESMRVEVASEADLEQLASFRREESNQVSEDVQSEEASDGHSNDNPVVMRVVEDVAMDTVAAGSDEFGDFGAFGGATCSNDTSSDVNCALSAPLANEDETHDVGDSSALSGKLCESATSKDVFGSEEDYVPGNGDKRASASSSSGTVTIGRVDGEAVDEIADFGDFSGTGNSENDLGNLGKDIDDKLNFGKVEGDSNNDFGDFTDAGYDNDEALESSDAKQDEHRASKIYLSSSGGDEQIASSGECVEEAGSQQMKPEQDVKEFGEFEGISEEEPATEKPHDAVGTLPAEIEDDDFGDFGSFEGNAVEDEQQLRREDGNKISLDDEEFGDFGDFSDAKDVLVARTVSAEQPVVSSVEESKPPSSSHIDERDKDDFGDFGDFCTVDSEAKPSDLEQNIPSREPKSKGKQTEPDESAFGNSDDFGDFDSFNEFGGPASTVSDECVVGMARTPVEDKMINSGVAGHAYDQMGEARRVLNTLFLPFVTSEMPNESKVENVDWDYSPVMLRSVVPLLEQDVEGPSIWSESAMSDGLAHINSFPDAPSSVIVSDSIPTPVPLMHHTDLSELDKLGPSKKESEKPSNSCREVSEEVDSKSERDANGYQSGSIPGKDDHYSEAANNFLEKVPNLSFMLKPTLSLPKGADAAKTFEL